MRALPPALALALALSAAPALIAAPADTALTGTWHITGPIPGKGRPADLGDLKVDATGTYQWSENQHLAGLGTLQPHQPSGGARAGQGCWLFHRGKGDLYAFRDGEVMDIYDAASNTLIGKGSRPGSKTGAKRR